MIKKYINIAKPVVAVQLDLDTPGLTYTKWGAVQVAKAQDWIVNNAGDVYSIDRESFAKTYVKVGEGLYKKEAPVWAEQAKEDGAIPTKEGSTAYKAGDYLTYNNPDLTDGWAIAADKFLARYTEA